MCLCQEYDLTSLSNHVYCLCICVMHACIPVHCFFLQSSATGLLILMKCLIVTLLHVYIHGVNLTSDSLYMALTILVSVRKGLRACSYEHVCVHVHVHVYVHVELRYAIATQHNIALSYMYMYMYIYMYMYSVHTLILHACTCIVHVPCLL